MSVYEIHAVTFKDSTIPVDMRVSGHLGFHHSMRSPEAGSRETEFRPTGEDWTVTHIPTGKAVATFDLRRHAMSLVQETGEDSRWKKPFDFPGFIHLIKDRISDLQTGRVV